MVSNCCNKRVKILLCLILFSSVHFSESNDEFINNAFDVPPNLKSLSNVHVRLDNKVTSLSKILGPNVDAWQIGEDDAKEIARITSAALACNYSKIIFQIIQSVEYIAETCNEISKTKSAHLCHGQLKQFFNDYRSIVLDILCSTSYYAEYLKVHNKNFFMAVLGVHIFFNRDEPFADSTESILQYDHRISHMRFSLESYTTELCTPPTFDDIKFRLKKVCIFRGENGLENFILCVRTILGTSISGEALDPANLGQDEKDYKRDLFAINNLMMSKLLETELIQGENISAIKNLVITFRKQHLSLNTILEQMTNGHRLENIIKYQALVIECLGSIMFYLISKIIKKNQHSEGTSEAMQVNEYISKAVETLESLSSNSNSWLSWSLDNIKLKRIIRNDRHDLTKAISGFYFVSNIKEKSVGKLFEINQLAANPSTKKCLNEYIDILDKFIKSIEQLKPFFFVTTEVINEPFNNLQNYKFIFVESDSQIIVSDGHSQRVKKNCEFALFLTKHFVLSAGLVSQCKYLPTEIINADHSKIVECFSKVKKYGNKSIKTIIKQYYKEFIIWLTKDDYRVGVYYKMIDAMYSLLLYLNNLEIYNVIKTEDPTVNLEDIGFKGDSIIRFYRTIVNPLQLYVNQFCNVPASWESFAINHYLNADERHHQIENKNLPLIIDDTIERIKLNLKTYIGHDNHDEDLDAEEDDDNDFSLIDEDHWDDDYEIEDDYYSNDSPEYESGDVGRMSETSNKLLPRFTFEEDDIGRLKINDEQEEEEDNDVDDDEIDCERNGKNDCDIYDSLSDSSPDDEYNLEERFAKTVYGRLDLRRFLFEDVVVNANTPGYCGSFINDVKVTWLDGRCLAVGEIVEIVKQQMHPQYVHACTVIIPRITIFLVSEMLLDIIEIIKNPEIDTINMEDANEIVKSIKTVFKFEYYYTSFFYYYNTLKYYLESFSRDEIDTGSCNRLIGLIKTKQAELGVQLLSPSMYKTLIANNTSNNPSTNVVNSLVESVNKLKVFARNVECIYKKLYYHRILNIWKNVNDFTIM